jgi:hypothetical protein
MNGLGQKNYPKYTCRALVVTQTSTVNKERKILSICLFIHLCESPTGIPSYNLILMSNNFNECLQGKCHGNSQESFWDKCTGQHACYVSWDFSLGSVI